MKFSITSTRLAALLIFFLALGVYANVLHGDFIGDDFFFIVDNEGVESLSDVGEMFTSPARTAISELRFDVYRPLAVLSFAATRHLFGLDPMAYHAINNLLHALNAVLLFLLFRRIAGDELIAAFAAAIFAVHPVQTEAVSWISGRGNVQFMFFLLLAFLAFLRWRDRQAGGSRPWLYVASLALYILSMFSKEHGIVLPALLLAWMLIVPSDGGRGWRRQLAALAPFFVAGAAFFIVRTAVLGHVGQMAPIGWLNQLLLGIQAVGRYMSLAVFPWPLSIDPRLPADICGIQTALYLLAIILAIYLALRVRRRSPLVAFGAAWFFIALLPVIHIVAIKAFIAERFLYLAIAGFALVATQAVFEAASRLRRRTAAIVALAILVAVYGTMTVVRNRDWKDPRTINLALLRVDPGSEMAFYNLGVYRDRMKDPDGAAAYFIKAMGKEGGIDMYARNNVAQWFLLRGNTEAAFALSSENIELYPDRAIPYVMKGVLYLNEGNYKAAEAMLLTAMYFDPESYQATTAMAELYRRTGRPEEAKQLRQKASRLDPDLELTPGWR